jgi:phosphoglycolate phosphatase-like HAD superfamily hydrolase
MPVLAIDYDGVIVDSVLDSLFVSHNAYLELVGSSNKKVFSGERLTFQNWTKIQKKYDQEIQYYRSLRPFIRGATDYGLIQKLLEEKRYLRNQQEFDYYRNTVQFEFQKFHQLFYQERKRLQEKSFEGWLKLEPAYQEVVRGINHFVQEGVKVVVATSNRREYIARAFHPNYYNIPIKEEDILDVSMGEDKSNQMKYINKYYGVQCDEIYFVDDQLTHLEQTRGLGIHVFLAGWSYATLQQKEKAVLEGIPIIEFEEDFYSMVKEYMKKDVNKREL